METPRTRKTWDWTILLGTFGDFALSGFINFANDYGDGVKGTDQNRIGRQNNMQ